MIYRTPEQQQQRLIECLGDPTCKVTYWCSDQWGGPANHDCANYGADWRAYPGRVDDIGGTPSACSARGLHATDTPHKWKGQRVWIVGLWNWVPNDDKYAATRREVICEVVPESIIDQSVAVRLGIFHSLYGARLVGASLVGARLDGANLYGANLYGARLVGARLDGARLDGANLVGASLYYARLDGCNMRGIVGTSKAQRLDFAARGAINVDTETQ